MSVIQLQKHRLPKRPFPIRGYIPKTQSAQSRTATASGADPKPLRPVVKSRPQSLLEAIVTHNKIPIYPIFYQLKGDYSTSRTGEQTQDYIENFNRHFKLDEHVAYNMEVARLRGSGFSDRL